MFILIVILLTLISVSLRMIASSLDLVNGVRKRVKNKGLVTKSVGVTFKISSSVIRFLAVIVDLARSFMVWIGSFVLMFDIIILVFILLCSTLVVFS